MRAAKYLLVLLVVVLLAGCSYSPHAIHKVVCMGRDGSVIQSSAQSYWWLEQRSGVYQSGPSRVFQPRAGDECHVQEVR